MLFDKKISTKNLYLGELQMCVNKDYERGTVGFNSTTTFKHISYVLAKPLDWHWDRRTCIEEVFIDVLTKSKYIYRSDLFEEGAVYIRKLIPCTTNKNYITIEEATKILEATNPIFLDLTSVDKEETQKVFSKKH